MHWDVKGKQRLSSAGELADDDVHIHVIGRGARHIETGLGETDELGVGVEGVCEVRTVVVPGVGLVRCKRRRAGAFGGQASSRGVQIEGVLLDVRWRVAGLRPVDDVGPVEAQQAVTDFGRGFPVVGLIVEISVEELLKVVDG